MTEEVKIEKPSSEPQSVGNLNEVQLKRRKIPKKISLSDVPDDIKEAMGINKDAKNFNELIEADPAVAEEISKIQPKPEEMLEGTIIQNTAGMP